MEITDTEYLQFQNKGSNDLILAFMPFGVPKGKFAMSNALKNCSFDVLYINCKDNLFYLEGVEGLGDCLGTTLDRLKDIVNAYQVKGKVVALGSSMGGNGAIHYGGLSNVDIIIAFGYKASINELSYTFKNNENKNRVNHIPQYTKILRDTESEVFLMSGDNEVTDYISMCMAPNKDNIKRLLYSSMDHYLMTYMDALYGLDALVGHIFDGDFTVTEIAYTPTISSFCANLLRESFVKTSIDERILNRNNTPLIDHEKAAFLSAISRIEFSDKYNDCMYESLSLKIMPAMLIRLFKKKLITKTACLKALSRVVNKSYTPDYITNNVK